MTFCARAKLSVGPPTVLSMHRRPTMEAKMLQPEMTGEASAAAAGEPSDSVTIDCDRCTMRGIGCGDCVVTVLLGGPPYGVALDETERHALDVLADAGLIPPLRMVEPLESRYIDPT